MDSLPNVNFVKFKSKHPFYTIFEDNGILYVRKRRDDLCSKPYKKLLPDDAAALFLLPKEAVKEFLFSLWELRSLVWFDFSTIQLKESVMAFGKTKLPLSNAERLKNHMSVFQDTLDSLKDLEIAISEDLAVVEEKQLMLSQDLLNTRSAIERVRLVTG